jgi:hypothetical protein
MMAIGTHLGGVPVLKFEGHQPCKKRCGVKLSNDRLNIGEAAR